MKKIMPRFEFRAFAQNFGMVEEKIRRLGLQEYENVNYLLAIKRILGMELLPE